MATWLVHGNAGLQHYRTLRIKSPNGDSYNFHDGFEVLPCILAHHEVLRTALQKRGDSITQRILTLIDSSMLKPKDQRCDASDLWMMAFGPKSIFALSTNIVNSSSFGLSPLTSANLHTVDTKSPSLLEPQKQSPSGATSTSTHESFQQAASHAATNLIAGRSSENSVDDGCGTDVALKLCPIDNPSISSPPSNIQLPRITGLGYHSSSLANPATASQQSSAYVQRGSSSNPSPDWPVKLLRKWRQDRDHLPHGDWMDDLKDRHYVRLHTVLVVDLTNVITDVPCR